MRHMILLALLLGACSKEPTTVHVTAPVAAAEPDDPIPAGTVAPEFEATAHDGTKVTLSSLRGHPVVLYFYPKDATPG